MLRADEGGSTKTTVILREACDSEVSCETTIVGNGEYIRKKHKTIVSCAYSVLQSSDKGAQKCSYTHTPIVCGSRCFPTRRRAPSRASLSLYTRRLMTIWSPGAFLEQRYFNHRAAATAAHEWSCADPTNIDRRHIRKSVLTEVYISIYLARGP